MAALQHFIVLFWVALTVYVLSTKSLINKSDLLLAVCLGALATFTSGNGFAVWPTGLLVLLVRREFKLTVYWVGYSIFAILIYFWHFPLQGSPSEKGISKLFENASTKIIAFLAGLGGAIRFEGTDYFFDDAEINFSLAYPEIYVGLITVLLFAWILKRAFLEYEPGILFILGTSVFVYISFLLIVLGRSSASGNITVFRSRYYPYSLLAISNTIFLLAFILKSKPWHIWILRVSIISGVAFWGIWQIVSYHKIVNHNNMLQAGFFNWQRNERWTMYQETAFYEMFYNRTFDKMKKNGFPYQESTTPLFNAFKNKINSSAGFSAIYYKAVQREDNKIKISVLNDYAAPVKSMGDGHALVMASKRDTFLLWSTVSRASIRGFLFTGQLCRAGYKVDITLDRQVMPKGIYSLHQFDLINGKGIISTGKYGTIIL